MNKNKGISLITFVITIVVILIISAAIILSVSQNNAIDKAKEAKIRQDMVAMRDKFNMEMSSQYINNNGNIDNIDINTLPKSEITPDEYSDVMQYDKLGLIYIGYNEQEINIAKELGIRVESLPKLPIISRLDLVPQADGIHVTVLLEKSKYKVKTYIYKFSTNGTSWTSMTSDKAEHVYSNIQQGVKYKVKVEVIDEKENHVESEVKEVTTLSLDKPTISNVGWFNVTTTTLITFPDSSILNEYSFDGTNWTSVGGKTQSLEIASTTTIYARAKDSNDLTSSYSGTVGIDRIAPVISSVSPYVKEYTLRSL